MSEWASSHQPPPQHLQPLIDAISDAWSHKRRRRLPAFLDHFKPRDLKIFFRCWVAVWVASLLLFITPSLATIGTATFFACIILIILPPSGIVFVYLLGALSLFIGICLAWAWGVIVMKAALAARPAAETQARLGSLQQVAVTQANQTGIAVASAAQVLIFDGYMLDVRVTAITYCLICTFVYLMARLRASNPKTALTSLFGIIISDIFLNFIPLLPSFSGTLPLSLVKPAAIGVGLGVACSVLFFPRSTSHVVLDSMEDLIEHLKSPLALTCMILQGNTQMLDIRRLHKKHSEIIKIYQAMEPAMAFLPIDFSVGCWGAADVASLKEPMRQTVAAILTLLEFHISRMYGEARREETLRKYADEIEATDLGEKGSHQVGAHQLSRLAELLNGLRCPDSQPVSEEVIGELVLSSETALEISLEALSVTKECIHMVNCRRWFWRASAAEREALYERSQTALNNLKTIRSAFTREVTQSLIDGYSEDGQLRDDRADGLRGLVLGMVFEQHMSTMIDKTQGLLAQVASTFHNNPHTRLWWPMSLQYAASWATGKKDKAPVMAQPTDDNPDDASDPTKAAQEKLRMSRKYRTKRPSGLGRVILGTYHWFSSYEGLYALRMVVVTIALGIPGVIPHSAGFYYREKGLWGLIMAQTGLLVYMADFTFSLLSRIVGTVAGGALGLLAWYIGSANGPGNPYGLAAIMAVMLVIFVWVRLYLPPNLLQGGIMGAATFLLVVAYSFNDTHIPQYGNPGIGYTVFWRRLLLVLVGVGTATIVQIFPRPPSAARHISKTLSHTIRSLSDHYALLLSCWGHSRKEGRLLAEPISLQVTESLVMLDGPIELLRFEFSSCRFDSESLRHVKELCHSLNRNVGRLLVLSDSLPLEFQERLARQTGLLNHQLIGEIMAVLGVCEQALKTGDAPPEILPSPLIRRSFEHWQLHLDEVGLSAEAVRDENFRRYCVALSAYLKFLGTVDELVLVVKGVLGEAHLVSEELLNLV